MTHCAGPAGPRRRTLCGIRLTDDRALPYCGAPRFVRHLDTDAPHCPACLAQLEDPPDPQLGWAQLRLVPLEDW